MIECDLNNKNHRLLFRRFYQNYIEDLCPYSERIRDEMGSPVREDAISFAVYEIEHNKYLKRFFLTDQNRVPIGFLLLGFDQNTHPETDYYIAEFFVDPSVRRQGHGQSAVKEMLKKYPGKYCYFVLKENKIANDFWIRMQNKFGCVDITNDCICYDTPDDCTFHAFKYEHHNV